MIETLLFDELQKRTKFPVYPKVPETPPDRFLVLHKTGASFETQISTSTIAVQSYGESTFDAATINETVKEAMLSLTDLDEISAVSLNSDYDYTDTQEKKDRYQAVFVITHY